MSIMNVPLNAITRMRGEAAAGGEIVEDLGNGRTVGLDGSSQFLARFGVTAVTLDECPRRPGDGDSNSPLGWARAPNRVLHDLDVPGRGNAHGWDRGVETIDLVAHDP